MPRISRRLRRKMAVEALLRERDLKEIEAMAEREPNVTSALFGLLSEPDALLRWRAIEAVGVLAHKMVEEGGRDGRAQVKDLVRRQLWTMTEESGGTAWHAAEAVGEMLYNVQSLTEEFATVLAGNGDTEPYEAPCAWAVARLANSPARQWLACEVPAMMKNLEHADPDVRGNSAVALGRLGDEAAISALQALVQDEGKFERYDFDAGVLREMTVGQAASAAVAALSV